MSRARRIAEIPAGSWSRWLLVAFPLAVVALRLHHEGQGGPWALDGSYCAPKSAGVGLPG